MSRDHRRHQFTNSSLTRRPSVTIDDVGEMRPTDPATDLDARRRELQSLREERDTLRNWLDRGVAECKTLAEEVRRLEGALESAETTTTSLRRRNTKLTSAVEALQQEVDAAQSKVEDARLQRERLQATLQELTEEVEETRRSREDAHREAERLSSEVVRMAAKGAELSEAQRALAELVHVGSQTVHTLQSLQRDADAHAVGEPLSYTVPAERTPSADRSSENQDTASVTAEAAKISGLLRSTSDGVQQAINRVICLYIEQERQRRERREREIAMIEAEKVSIAEAHKLAMARMQDQLSAMQEEARRRGTSANEKMSADQLSEFQRIVEDRQRLEKDVEQMKQENDALRRQIHELQINWHGVAVEREQFDEARIQVDYLTRIRDQLLAEKNELARVIESLRESTPSPKHGSITNSSIHRVAFARWKAAQEESGL